MYIYIDIEIDIDIYYIYNIYIYIQVRQPSTMATVLRCSELVLDLWNSSVFQHGSHGTPKNQECSLSGVGLSNFTIHFSGHQSVFVGIYPLVN